MDTSETKEEKSSIGRKEEIKSVKKVSKSFDKTTQNQSNSIVEPDFSQGYERYLTRINNYRLDL